jgi:SagB-type dehydrogenase family enzyme
VAENVLAGSRMGMAVLTDPQFTLPTRPRLARGLVRVMTDDSLIVEGGPSRQSFRGALARNDLPALMDDLDGSSTVDELLDRSGERRHHVFSMLALLYSTGLIEEAGVASADSALEGYPEESAAYLSRSIDSTRVNRSAVEALQRMTAQRILVVGTGHEELVRNLVTSLAADHLDVGGAACPAGPEAMNALVQGVDLLVILGQGAALEELCHVARTLGVTALPVLAVGDRLLIGPELGTSNRSCASCVFSQRSALASAQHAAMVGSPARSSLAAAFLTREISAMVSRVGTSDTGKMLVAVDLDTWSQDRFSLPPLPDCAVCMAEVSIGAESGVPLAWAYEESVAFPARESCDPKSHQVHYKAGNIELQRRNRRWLSAPSVPLPAPADLGTGFPVGAARPQRRDCDLSVVATLLTRMAGLREAVTASTTQVSRWCASGGNLGSVNAYVIARSVIGLPSGVYAYQRGDDSLALLPWASPPEDAPGQDPSVQAHIVLTGSLDVVGQKYGPFAWRIVHLDAGAAIAQGRLVAAQLGVDLPVAPVWNDDALAALLGSDPDLEPITGVLHLRSQGSRP